MILNLLEMEMEWFSIAVTSFLVCAASSKTASKFLSSVELTWRSGCSVNHGLTAMK